MTNVPASRVTVTPEARRGPFTLGVGSLTAVGQRDDEPLPAALLNSVFAVSSCEVAPCNIQTSRTGKMNDAPAPF